MYLDDILYNAYFASHLPVAHPCMMSDCEYCEHQTKCFNMQLVWKQSLIYCYVISSSFQSAPLIYGMGLVRLEHWRYLKIKVTVI